MTKFALSTIQTKIPCFLGGTPRKYAFVQVPPEVFVSPPVDPLLRSGWFNLQFWGSQGEVFKEASELLTAGVLHFPSSERFRDAS